MGVEEAAFSELLSNIVDNRGRTCPTADEGIALIATNCIKPDQLYPAFEKLRYVSPETYGTWFRGHPAPGDIIFVCKGSPGRTALAPDPVEFCIAQDMVAVRADPGKIHPPYLLAVLRSRLVQDRIARMHVGTLIPHFKKGDFKNLSIPLLDPAGQKMIGDLYSEFSFKIESNRRAVLIADRLAIAYVESLVASGATTGTTLAEAVAFNPDTVRPGPTEDSVDYIDIAAVSSGRVEEVQHRRWAEAPSRARRGVADGDVIYSTVRPGRRSFSLLLSPSPTTVASTGFAVMRPTARCGSSFLTALVSAPQFSDYLEAVAQGSAYPAVSVTSMSKYPVRLPSEEDMHDFEERTMPLRRKAAQLWEENRRLAVLRDAYVSRLLAEAVMPDTEQPIGAYS